MIGAQFGHYELLSRVGSGGMGVVYLARDLRLQRQVAIKFLPDGVTTDAKARERFLREARALSRLNHPNIATIYDFDSQDGRDFLVMEYIEGSSLRDVTSAPLPPSEVIRLGIQLSEALVAAHGAGVVHLDLKPGNLMVTPEGRLKVLDFGLARLHADPTDATTRTLQRTETSSAAIGTPPYMSPEQILAAQVDRRSDIYGAGATLYELLTGRWVFEARSTEMPQAILETKPEPPSRYNAAVSPELDRIVLKALSKHPGDRQQSAEELQRDLRGCDTAAVVTVPAPRRSRRGRLLLVAAGCIAAASVTGWAVWPVTPRFHERDFVLIGDFDAPPQDEALGRALKEALTISLQQSRFVNVAARDRVVDTLRRMQRPATTAIDEDTGLDLCRRESLNALVVGGVSHAGATTRITVKVLAAASGSLLAAEQAEYARPDDVFDRIDDLSRRVRHDLGESLDRISSSSQPVEKVTTRRFEALVQYSRAVEARAMGNYNAVEAPLLSALALDPDFAMAQLKLGDYYMNIAGDDVKALPYFEAAYRLRDHVTEREKYFIAAEYFGAREQYEEARDNLKILTSLYPDVPEYHYELALAYYSLEDLPPAIAELRQAIRLNPHGVRAHGSLVLFLTRADQPEAALDASHDAQSRGLESPYLHWARGLALLEKGDFAGASRDFDVLGQTPGYYTHLGMLQQARALLYQGHLEDGIARLRDLVQVTQREGDTSLEVAGRVLLGRAAALLGDTALAREQALAVSQLASTAALRPTQLREAGSLAIAAKDRRLAEQTLKQLEDLEAAAPTPLARAARLCLAGELALFDRRYAGALQFVAESQALRPWYRTSVIAAQAREARDDWAGAAAAWRNVLGAKGQILQNGNGFPPDLALAQHALTRTLEHVNAKE